MKKRQLKKLLSFRYFKPRPRPGSKLKIFMVNVNKPREEMTYIKRAIIRNKILLHHFKGSFDETGKFIIGPIKLTKNDSGSFIETGKNVYKRAKEFGIIK